MYKENWKAALIGRYFLLKFRIFRIKGFEESISTQKSFLKNIFIWEIRKSMILNLHQGEYTICSTIKSALYVNRVLFFVFPALYLIKKNVINGKSLFYLAPDNSSYLTSHLNDTIYKKRSHFQQKHLLLHFCVLESFVLPPPPSWFLIRRGFIICWPLLFWWRAASCLVAAGPGSRQHNLPETILLMKRGSVIWVTFAAPPLFPLRAIHDCILPVNVVVSYTFQVADSLSILNNSWAILNVISAACCKGFHSEGWTKRVIHGGDKNTKYICVHLSQKSPPSLRVSRMWVGGYRTVKHIHHCCGV